MIDNTQTEKQDRFHASAEKECAAPKAAFYMTYLPQGMQHYKVCQSGYSFTEGKDYPVFEKKDYGAHVTLKTIDDSGKERWIKDDYFVPANQRLFADKECGWSVEGRAMKVAPTLTFADELNGEMVDLRKLAAKKSEEEAKEKGYKITIGEWKDPLPDTNILAGVASQPTVTEEEILTGVKRKRKAKKADGSNYWKSSFDPVSKENPLLADLDKLVENMGKVFPEYRKVDTDGLMAYIQGQLPNRKIEWNNGVLTVDGAKTNVLRADVNVAFDGLKKLTTPKMADKLVGKVIVNKLKKLF